MDSLYLSRFEHKNMSVSMTQQQKVRIHRKKRSFQSQTISQSHQPIIPSPPNQGSSNFHLHQQIRLLKKKNTNFESHMNHMKLQYQQLKLTLESINKNQKLNIIKFLQIQQKCHHYSLTIQSLNNQINLLNQVNYNLQNQLEILKAKSVTNSNIVSQFNNQQTHHTKNIQLQQQIKTFILKSEEETKILLKQLMQKLQLAKQNLEQDNSKLIQHTTLIQQLTKIFQQNNDKLTNFQQQYHTLTTSIAQSNKQLQQKINQINILKLKQNKLNQQNILFKSLIKQFQHQLLKLKNNQYKNVNFNIYTTVSLIQNKPHQPTKINQLQQLPTTLNEMQQKMVHLHQKIKQLQQQLSRQRKQKLKQISILQNQLNFKDKQLLKLTLQLANYQQIFQQPTQIQDQQIQQQSYGQGKTLQQLQLQYNSQLKQLKHMILTQKHSQLFNIQKPTKLNIPYQNKLKILLKKDQKFEKQNLALQIKSNSRRQTTTNKILQEINKKKFIFQQQTINLLQIENINLN